MGYVTAARFATSVKGLPLVRQHHGLIVRFLLWLVLLVIVLAVFFVIGYLFGPHLLTHHL